METSSPLILVVIKVVVTKVVVTKVCIIKVAVANKDSFEMKYSGNLICLKRLRRLSVVYFLAAPLAYGEIYKWTDGDGNVYYSDKKPATIESKAERVKISSQVNSIPRIRPSKSFEDVNHKRKRLKEESKQESSTDSRQVKADKSIDPRCKLARSILSGDAVLRNGLETGKHEIEVAKRDVRKFCN